MIFRQIRFVFQKRGNLLRYLYGIIFWLLLYSTIPAAAQNLSWSVNDLNIPKWAQHQPIYEVDIERVTPEGTFNALTKQLPRLKALGVGIIWLMPIHQRGSFRVDQDWIDSLGGTPIPVPEQYRRQGRSTSPYNIHDHYSVNPKYGTPEDLKALVSEAHQLGLYVILDWVINHTSWDHVFIDEHPDFYARNDNGSVPYTTPWKDIAQLDYANRKLWEYMSDLTVHWVKEYDLDGFRTDVADRIPTEFWSYLRPRLNAVKQVLLLAEGDGADLYPTHNITYDWYLPTAFWSIKAGKRTPDVLDTLLAWEREQYPEGYLRMRHATNHDIQRSGFGYPGMARYFDPVFEEDFFKEVSLQDKFDDGLKAYMVLCATLPNSVPMLWNGQEVGIIEDTPRTITWEDNAWTDFYTKLLGLYQKNDALLFGDFQRIKVPKHPEIYAFSRATDTAQVMVMINCSDQAQNFALDSGWMSEVGEEAFSGKPIALSQDSSLALPAWGFNVIIVRD